MLLRGVIDLEVLKDDLLEDPALKDLAARVEMILSEEYEAMRPMRNPAKVSVQLRDGRSLTREVMNGLGDPLEPMPEKAIFDKFLSLAGPVIGPNPAKEFMGRVQGLESVKNVQSLFSFLRKDT
jgi:2-methylcitrate dehydratase PrpD